MVLYGKRSFDQRRLRHFPTRRSADLLRGLARGRRRRVPRRPGRGRPLVPPPDRRDGERADDRGQDRKSTRLNSSHVEKSYAVFCFKKKKPLFIANLASCRDTSVHSTA